MERILCAGCNKPSQCALWQSQSDCRTQIKIEMDKIKKEYLVNVDMRWSMDYEVKACSETEAKRLAWEKFKKNPPKKCFEISADKK